MPFHCYKLTPPASLHCSAPASPFDTDLPEHASDRPIRIDDQSEDEKLLDQPFNHTPDEGEERRNSLRKNTTGRNPRPFSSIFAVEMCDESRWEERKRLH